MDARADPLRSWPIDNGINFSMVCVIVIILPTGCTPPVSKQCILNKLGDLIVFVYLLGFTLRFNSPPLRNLIAT
mgnify:CR=1 FL=1